MWLERDAHEAPREAVICSPARGELRFAPGRRGRAMRAAARWSVEGDARRARRRRCEDGRLLSPLYPDALARVWAALDVPDLGRGAAVGAAPGYEFARLGRARRTSAAAATARCTPQTRSARSSSAGSAAAAQMSPRSGRSATSRRSCDGHFGLQLSVAGRLTRRWRTVTLGLDARDRRPHRRLPLCSRLPATSALAAPAATRRLAATARGPVARTHVTPPRAPRRRRTPEAPVPVAASERSRRPGAGCPPTGSSRSPTALPKMRAVRAKYPGSYGGAYLKGPLRWQVSFFSARARRRSGR